MMFMFATEWQAVNTHTHTALTFSCLRTLSMKKLQQFSLVSCMPALFTSLRIPPIMFSSSSPGGAEGRERGGGNRRRWEEREREGWGGKGRENEKGWEGRESDHFSISNYGVSVVEHYS